MSLDEKSVVYEQIWDELMRLADESVDYHKKTIKHIVDDMLHRFIEKLNTEIISKNHFKLSDKDRKNIQRAEQFLNEHLLGDFPGIEKTAHKVRVSPTKLKSDFKNLHETTLYQYFSGQQMQAAHELLQQKKYTVKEIAALFGYEKASKFSAVFKKKFNLLPSEV